MGLEVQSFNTPSHLISASLEQNNCNQIICSKNNSRGKDELIANVVGDSALCQFGLFRSSPCTVPPPTKVERKILLFFILSLPPCLTGKKGMSPIYLHLFFCAGHLVHRNPHFGLRFLERALITSWTQELALPTMAGKLPSDGGSPLK